MAGNAKLSAKYTIYGILIVVLVGFYVLRSMDIKLTLPTRAKVEAEKRQALRLREDIQQAALSVAENDAARLDLDNQTADFWTSNGRVPTNQVQAHIEKLARKSGLRLNKVGPPKIIEVSNHIRAIEVTISSSTTMKSTSAFVAAVERNTPGALEWYNCTIRPNRTKDPTGVTLAGKIRAYVLTAEASEFLAGDPPQ
jgi:hypothetical protein